MRKFRIVPHYKYGKYYIIEEQVTKKFLWWTTTKWEYKTLAISQTEAEEIIEHLKQEPKIYE